MNRTKLKSYINNNNDNNELIIVFLVDFKTGKSSYVTNVQGPVFYDFFNAY